MSKFYDFTDKNFAEEVEQFKGICVVDFWAPWCVPCKMQSPAIDTIYSDYASNEKIKVGKLNVDDNNATAGKFGVMSIPTVIIYKDGVPVDKTVGVTSVDTLKNKIDKNL